MMVVTSKESCIVDPVVSRAEARDSNLPDARLPLGGPRAPRDG
jgi:hypothetical protein